MKRIAMTAILPKGPHAGAAARAWKVLSSMSFAVAMLFIVAVAAVAGSLIEQEQAYSVYVSGYGTLWADFYRLAGVDDIYHAGWFLLLLALLAFSTGLCVWQKAASMVREMRSFKEGASYAQLRRLPATVHLHQAAGGVDARARMESVLRAHGFSLHQGATDGTECSFTGKKGSLRRAGYLLTHVAVVVICMGGLADGNLPLKWRLASGALTAETRDVPAEAAAPAAHVHAGSGSFRGALQLKQGDVKDLVVLNAAHGFLVRELPFRVRLNRFDIEYHPTGQPRDFVSQVDVIDPHDAHVLRSLRLSVNHPAEYAGIEFFQSGFEDGGTRVALDVLGPDGPVAAVGEVAVGSSRPVLIGDAPVRLEPTAFHPKNVIHRDAARGSLAASFLSGAQASRTLDLGPSVEFALTDAAGQVQQQTTYIRPVPIEERPYFVASVTPAAGGQARFVRIPMTADGSLAAYQRIVRALRHEKGRSMLAQRMAAMTADPQAAEVVRRAVPRVLQEFAVGGLSGLGGQGAATAADAGRDPVRQMKLDLLVRAGLLALGDQGGASAPQPPVRFVVDSLLAYSDWIDLGRPWLARVTGFQPVDATVLQVTQAPGRIAVYAGMACLAIGVVLLVLVQERRVWVRPQPAGGGVLLALAANRPAPSVATELEDLVRALAPQWMPSFVRSTS